jgi:four helix bundle protein
MIQDLIIYQKTYDLFLYLHPVIAKFPKNQRFVLGQRIENKILDMIRHIIVANTSKDKIPELKKVSIDMDEFRTLIRLAKDLHFISIRQYGLIADRINEIGRILCGWVSRYEQGNIR